MGAGQCGVHSRLELVRWVKTIIPSLHSLPRVTTLVYSQRWTRVTRHKYGIVRVVVNGVVGVLVSVLVSALVSVSVGVDVSVGFDVRVDDRVVVSELTSVLLWCRRW